MIETGKNDTAAAKAAMVGALRGSRTETLAAISYAAEIAIRNTARTGGDLGHVATGLVQGAIQCAQELGVTVEDAAASAADGALKGAHQVRSAAFDIVHGAMTQTISGVKVVMKKPDSTLMRAIPALPRAPLDALALATIEGEGGPVP
jgi:hypothetical protein